MEKRLKQTKSSCLRVVLLGPESTGKTTLAKKLAAHYNALWVPEFSRLYAEDKLKKNQSLTKNDVLPIAIGQMDLENEYAQKEKTILFCDTNLLETVVYSEYIYNGFCPKIIKRQALINSYDIYFLTDIDFPWQYDPVRSSELDRKKLFTIFKNTLKELSISYTLISGNEEERFKKAKEGIGKTI